MPSGSEQGSPFRCRWCGKTGKPSGWEQKVLSSDEYAPLCQSCARRRLDNLWNALLPVRKVAE